VTISVTSSGVGDILNDSHNRALYLFRKDIGPKSTCFGACAQNWPPVRASGKPTAGSGANASLIGTIKRSDGAPQVTYNGHPLYLYVGDNAPGAINGQGLTAFGANWYVVSPQGNQVTGKSTAAPSNGY
jgi:predicted lipoprotein with Yx(FWY)xxD motif